MHFYIAMNAEIGQSRDECPYSDVDSSALGKSRIDVDCYLG